LLSTLTQLDDRNGVYLAVRQSQHFYRALYVIDESDTHDSRDKQDCAERALTSANAKISTKSDPGFQSGLLD